MQGSVRTRGALFPLSVPCVSVQALGEVREQVASSTMLAPHLSNELNLLPRPSRRKKA